MSDRERIRTTSLDESFDADMRAALEGAAFPEAGAGVDAGDALLDYMRREFGLVRLAAAPTAPPAAGVGGWLRGIARRLFVSRTYHASVFSLLESLDERQRAVEQRLAATTKAQGDLNELLARLVFRLWGDYNHLVRVVLDHHINEVTPNLELSLATIVRDSESRVTEEVERITAALRELETRLGEMEGPHDRAVQSVAELVASLGREETLARRLDALEASLERRGAEPPAAG